MTVKVTEQGLLIPRRWLRGIRRAEIRRKKNRITIVPANGADPLRQLGRKPVRCGLTDAAANHDKYLYGAGA